MSVFVQTLERVNMLRKKVLDYGKNCASLCAKVFSFLPLKSKIPYWRTKPRPSYFVLHYSLSAQGTQGSLNG